MASVFGYGSLIWKGPPFDLESTPGYIKGFVRRFAQASHDHRGTPANPGRVVTLVTEEDWEEHRKVRIIWRDAGRADTPLCAGRVYRIPKERSDEIWAYLDHREKDGYTLRTVDVYGVEENGNEVIVEEGVRVYVGETHNPSFAGGMPMAELADHIARSVGPSGANKDYVYNLANAVRQLCPASEDVYLKDLERLVRERDPDHSNRVPNGL
ncbi:ChaC-like protein [Rhodotorula toruloides]|uniref:glutathione-specific gamma-glutamylcyclotransferase n=1 Tax=Rhodotorula toruloides TaxID=5286 RepID=A0A2S9ZW84_RHOTO|nr:ChaC-like protein [Rhodotorula toruloides]